MKRLLLPAFVSAGLLITACSTNRLVQQSNNDDVYYSEAKAKEVDYAQREEKSYRTDEQLYGGADYNDDVDYDFDYGYAARLNRFSYASPWRTYYDNWYTYSYDPWYSYRYDPWYYGSGLSLSFGWGNPYYYNYYSPWGIYGYSYPYGNYWGPISYYGGGYYPGYGYGGYYGGGVIVNSRPNQSRPNTGNGNPYYNTRGDRYSRPSSASSANGTSYRPERAPRNPSGQATNNNATGRASSERPARPERPVATERPARPERNSSPERNSYPESTPRTSSGGSYSSPRGGSSGSSSAPSRPDRPSRGR